MGRLVSLHEFGFDVVIFCLLLSYLPTPSLRYDCCKRARQLLRPDGLLVIITPDSNHLAKGAARMKAWRQAIEALGFQRWRYEKLKHSHCLAFRATPVLDSAGSCTEFKDALRI